MSHYKINYIELPVKNIEASKLFFASVLGWVFTDHSKDYCSFTGPGTDGAFYLSEHVVAPDQGAPRIVFHTHDLDKTIELIKAAGGEIIGLKTRFPGGSRIHFRDVNGNEFGIWSES